MVQLRASRKAVGAVGALAGLLVLLASPLPAPIHGFCRHLEDKVRMADTIAVLRLLEHPRAEAMRASQAAPKAPGKFNYDPVVGTYSGGNERYPVRVAASLVGELEPGREYAVSLRFVGSDWMPPDFGAADYDAETTRVLHLAFMKRGEDVNMPGKGIAAVGINCEFETIRLHPLTNLELSQGPGGVVERCQALLDDSARRAAEGAQSP